MNNRGIEDLITRAGVYTQPAAKASERTLETSSIIKLDDNADAGLRKLSDDIKKVAKSPLLKSKFPFIDGVKIIVLVSIIVVALKILYEVWVW